MNQLKNFIYIIILGCLFISCASESDKKKFSGKDISVSWEVLENYYHNNHNFYSQFVLKNNGSQALTNNGWDIYFNLPRNIYNDSILDPISITHINGDLYKLSPKATFNLPAGDSINLEFISSDWAINYTDAPAGLYIVFTDTLTGKESNVELLSYTVRPFVREAQYKRSVSDNTPLITSALTYEKNKNTFLLPKEKLAPVVPTPVYYIEGSTSVTLDPSYTIVASDALTNEKKYLSSTFASLLDKPLSDVNNGKTVELKIGEVKHKGKSLKQGDEAYQLDVKTDKISITGTDAAGVFYGIQSLKSLLPADAYKAKSKSFQIKEISIVDFPRFEYRGLMVDAARNFKPKANILKILDVMSFYKLNKFHFHIADDEGWRLEIKSLPELTEVGAKRMHSSEMDKVVVPSFGSGPFADAKTSYGTGHYTKEDFIEILKYAKERHIEVIPEIDLPGHSRAAIKSMLARHDRLMKEGKPQEAKKYVLHDSEDKSEYRSVQGWKDNVVCVCQNSTYNFIEAVVQEVVAIYKEADAPLTTIHTGGDEVPEGVWEKSKACQSLIQSDPTLDSTNQLAYYFLKRVTQIMQKQNLAMGGWEEIAIKRDKEGSTTHHNANPEFVNSNFRPYVWNNVWGWGTEDNGYKLANAGYKTILSNVTNLYFDLAYDKSPEEPGYYWGGFVDTRKPFEFIPYNIYLSATEDRMGNKLDKSIFKDKVKLTEKGKSNIIGLQGNLFSENTLGDNITEYLVFPKLLALSERAWSQDPAWSTVTDDTKRNQLFVNDWNAFANSLGQEELPRLDYMSGGVNYRISLPGAIIENGLLKANVEFPGLTIRYTTDGSEPTASSAVYTAPVKVSGNVKLKAFNSAGRSSRTVTVK
jgi:hexosaminidase